MKKYVLILFFVVSGVKAAEEIPHFTMVNQSDAPINITVTNNNTLLEKTLLPEEHIEKTILLSKTTTLMIMDQVEGTTPGVLWYGNLPQNKGLYLKWTKDKLQPQESTNGDTENSYSLANNITQDEIDESSSV